MDEREAVQRARDLFLDDRNVHGCAETTFIVLKEAFGLPDSANSAAAMALNGGVAYSGGICGAISGAAMAVGLLAERRVADHRAAKRSARLVTALLMRDFEREHGAVDCRELIGMDLRTEAQHQAFIESGIWRDRCLRQVEFAVERLAPLADEATWEEALHQLEEREP
jgi:C_GCAxxG_C_C family probable redox protein